MRMQSRKKTLAMALVLLMSLSASAVQAVTLGQIDDFQDGTTQGWRGSPTSNAADAGPNGAGDDALFVDSDGRIVTFNTAQWIGNFTAAGITQISIDVRNQNAFDLELRLGIAGGAVGPGGSGDTYVSSQSINVPGDGAWHSILFPILTSDFDPTSINSSSTPDASVALANQTHLRILHNPAPNSFLGVTGGGEFFLDNIQAIPEPATGMLLLLGVASLLLKRRSRSVM